jgi:acyl transferase domain-containing protein
METLHQQGYEVFLELGAKPTLLSMGRYCLPEGVGVWLHSLYQGRQDWQQILQSLGALYVRGAQVNWSDFDQDYPRRRIQLPTYPFQRQRYWVKFADEIADDSTERSPNVSKAGDLAQEAAKTAIANLLNQGDTQQLAQHLETVGELSDDELKLLPKLLELLVKQNQQQLTAASIKDWLYEVEWQPKPRQLTTPKAKNGSHKPGSWLIFSDMGGVGQTLAKVLRDRGDNCILVYPGDTYQTQEAGTWSINPSSATDMKRLFQDALATDNRPLQGVIHLWSLEAGLASELTIPALEQAQGLGVGSVLHLLQALVKGQKNKGITGQEEVLLSPSPRLWLVTRGAVPVGSSLPGVAQAPLWGLGKVVALEHREFFGGMIDLAPEATEDEATKLLAEIGDSQEEDHLAFRDGNRYVARLVRKQLPLSRGVSFQSDGTYLITGGLGALGLRIAQWMVEQGARQLVLTSRRGASSEAQETLNQLEQAGAKVVVAQADVSNQVI